MKVKIGELKAHLSKYVRQLREEGGEIEVCLREDPVAYLSATAPGADPRGTDEAVSLLKRSGLQVRMAQTSKGSVNLPKPLKQRNQKSRESIVNSLRRERNW